MQYEQKDSYLEQPFEYIERLFRHARDQSDPRIDRKQYSQTDQAVRHERGHADRDGQQYFGYGIQPVDQRIARHVLKQILHPPQAVDTAEGIEGGSEAGGLALFSPWGNVVMFYDSFGSYPGLYILGQAVEGIEQIGSLSGTIHVKAVK
ncbi:MAG: hypothetical protein II875_03710 [Clostridia bacterium]|nr:hypothetical protein [Clostridia bacterium]